VFKEGAREAEQLLSASLTLASTAEIDALHREWSAAGAEIVEALGDGVEDVSIGQRLGYATGPLGAYATLANVPAARAVAVPDGIDPVALATGLLKGMTARYLLEATFPVQRGDSILVQAAAGGVGQILLQWARHLGAETIAVVGSRPKADVALAAGATHVLVRGEDDIAAQARRLTGGEGVAVVYDSVGRDTFAESLDSLRPTGTMVSYGNASGPVPPVDPGLLAVKGSLFLTRPTLMHYVRTRALLEETAGHLFDMVLRGVVTLPTPRTLELADAADAHRLIESRAHAGTIALLP